MTVTDNAQQTHSFRFAMILAIASIVVGSQFSPEASASESLVTPKIIGGSEATPGDWPFVAALVNSGSANPYFGFFCGGSLIDSQWVVTAAHCTEGKTADQIHVVVGVHDLKRDLINGIGERVSVKRIVNHPDFKPVTLDGDIALLQLDAPVNIPAILPYSGSDRLAGESAQILGWGDTNLSPTGTSYPEVLQQAGVDIVSNLTCRQALGPGSVTINMMCAGFKEGGVDSCQGDSGGPLLIDQAGSWELAGLVSWGNGCAQPNSYGVYTRVSQYQSFIQDTVAFDFFACADVNNDGVADSLDQSGKQLELRQAVSDWRQSCFNSGSACGDVNEDGLINRADVTAFKRNMKSQYRDWLATCWEPEVDSL